MNQDTLILLRAVQRFSRDKNKKLYLVGGFLRDILLNKEKDNPDLDFCIASGAINFGRGLAKKLKAGFVVLDKEHGACRVVKKAKDKIYTLDFTDFRGKGLLGDLKHRDFTINALALDLEKAARGINTADFLDLSGGRKDLKVKLIRMINKNTFHEDPLRILRAFSLAAALNFKIDSLTLKLIKKDRHKLKNVSFERVRDELFKIFATGKTHQYLPELDRLNILELVFPEINALRGIGQGPYHHLDVWQHTLETVRELEILFEEIKANKDIQAYLREEISGQRARYGLIKLAALLHDFGKPATLRRKGGKITFHGHERVGMEMAIEVVRRLKLSNEELRALKNIILRHLRPGYLSDVDELTPRAVFRFFRDADKEAVSVLLLSIADQRATKGPLATSISRSRQEKTANLLIKEYFRKNKEKKAKRILNGNQVMLKFKLKPSPLIGEILAEIEELQAIGKIKTKEEAFRAAKKLIK